MNREERKRRYPAPVVQAQDIQQAQGQEAAPLYQQERIPHPMRGSEIVSESQRTPQRNEPRWNPSFQQYQIQHPSFHSEPAIVDDLRTLQVQIRRKNIEIAELKKKGVQVQSQVHNQKQKSIMLQEELDWVRAELRRRSHLHSQDTERELQRVKILNQHKTEENQLLGRQNQRLRAQIRRFQKKARESFQLFQEYKNQSESLRQKLQGSISELIEKGNHEQTYSRDTQRSQIDSIVQQHFEENQRLKIQIYQSQEKESQLVVKHKIEIEELNKQLAQKEIIIQEIRQQVEMLREKISGYQQFGVGTVQDDEQEIEMQYQDSLNFFQGFQGQEEIQLVQNPEIKISSDMSDLFK